MIDPHTINDCMGCDRTEVELYQAEDEELCLRCYNAWVASAEERAYDQDQDWKLDCKRDEEYLESHE